MYPGPGPLYTPRTRKYILDNFSPAGLHVLVVDDDPLCLMVLERMLKQCHYKVTTCNKVSLALKLLRENEEDFDLVISDVYMPDADGFKLLEVIGLELDLPVIMISANGDTSVVMKGIIHGACDYLIKPVRIEELRNIWQHIIRRKGKDFHRSDLQGECDAGARAVEPQEESFRKRKELFEVADFDIEDISSCPKKARVNWSMHLHQQFVNAVNQLGVDKAVPKKILDIMNVQGLTRENVASHLQKYRLYLKRLSGVMPEPCPVASFQASGDETPGGTMLVKSGRKGSGPVTSVKGLNLGAGLGSGAGKGRKVDAGTLKSLSQYKVLQQRKAANRAQVLSAIGVEDPMGTMSSSGGGLLRMASLDLGFLMHSQQLEDVPSHLVQCVDAVDDLATYDFSRSVKLEDDMVMPGTVTGKGIYDRRREGVRKGLIAHSNIKARRDKQLSKINYGINDEVHMLKLDYGGSLSSQDGDLKHGYAGQVNMQGLREGAIECKDKVMPSTINERSKHDYCDAYSSGQVNMQALCEEVIKCTEQMTPSSTNEWGKLDYVQDNLQPMHEDTSKEVAVLVGESTDDTDSSTKVSYELSAGSTATEMSGEAFSVCSFDALMGDLGIISDADHHLMQQNNSELLDVDKFLQLD